VLLIVPAIILPIVLLGAACGLSRENQDWIAASSGAASESLLAAQTVQAFTPRGHPGALRDLTEKSFVSARDRIGVRAVMTAIVIFLIFAGVVGVLWIGARDVATGA
jgi:ATP-binding cassette subfamily B protein